MREPEDKSLLRANIVVNGDDCERLVCPVCRDTTHFLSESRLDPGPLDCETCGELPLAAWRSCEDSMSFDEVFDLFNHGVAKDLAEQKQRRIRDRLIGASIGSLVALIITVAVIVKNESQPVSTPATAAAIPTPECSDSAEAYAEATIRLESATKVAIASYDALSKVDNKNEKYEKILRAYARAVTALQSAKDEAEARYNEWLECENPTEVTLAEDLIET